MDNTFNEKNEEITNVPMRSKRKKKMISITVDEKLYEKFTKINKERTIPNSVMISAMISDYVRQYAYYLDGMKEIPDEEETKEKYKDKKKL